MAKTKISEFSSTAGNNTDIDSINIAEGCAPSGINNAIRELMAQLKDFQTGAAGDSFNGPVGTTTAAAGAFTTLTASGTLGVTGVATLGNGAVLGTPASVTLTNGTGLPIATGVSGLGTGVATALAVNVGSAGAPVINGGALGTPSSGTVTNLTGTASININGTVGATTANTGAFTTLTTSSTVTLNGGTANGVAYLNGSKVLATGSALTFDGNTARNNQSSGTNAYFRTTSGTVDAYFGAATAGLSTGVVVGSFSNSDVVFYQNSSEQMRLTSTGLELKGKLAAGYTDFSGIPTNGAAFSGSVGIGTSSPTEKLTVNGNIKLGTSGTSHIYGPATTGRSFFGNSDATAYIGIYGSSYGSSLDSVISFVAGTSNSMTFNASGNLGLGVTPSAWSTLKGLQVLNANMAGLGNKAYFSANAFFNGSNWIYQASDFANLYIQQDGQHQWNTAPSGTAGNAISFTQAMTLSASGSLGIGTTSPSTRLSLGGDTGQKLSVYDTGGVRSGFGVDMGGSSYELSIFAGYNGGNGQITFGGLDTATNTYTERARITSGGDLLVGTTSSTPDLSNVAGAVLGATGTVVGSRSDGPGAAFNRKTNDGTIVSLRQDGTEEGNISVSGTTVSYNGGHLSRWAQMLAKPELFKGTVMSNLDEMNVYTDADGNPVENEQLNKVKVSDVEGDANVAGVFVNWTYDDAHNVDEINMAMTGDMIIRIAQGVIVQRGDLLMSAGDGTAKPQGDDIVRSKTVAKVTSTHVTCTYADGSFCVPCVLMAC